MANKEQVYAKIAEAIEEAEHDPDMSGGEIVEYAVETVKSTLGVQCDSTYCGGFDSPGYDIHCYAIAFVTNEGELGLYDYQYEIY
ncbi:hypothetical protein RJP21_04905 [Paenibacillus sp. VCA1]|uniref:hypothetical protein n=1 Tax=Paenibacillus sp. VCA1 TaxID=3039148 RepID=UPI0028722851|nr:hypothetical protein [Paenibacillus sp. VCA1]MDR9852938.1 hypothetical protein [Paenibacillus sp. VCA1]